MMQDFICPACGVTSELPKPERTDEWVHAQTDSLWNHLKFTASGKIIAVPRGVPKPQEYVKF